MYYLGPVVFFLGSLIISCSGQSAGDIRLWRNGGTSTSYNWGRLQIYVGQKWNEVCDDGFGQVEADVACHQLQFTNSTASANISGSGSLDDDVSNLTGSIGISDIYCPTNDYLHLLRCSVQLGQHSCAGNGYTMLQCDTSRIYDTPYIGQLRLLNGAFPSRGVVLIYCDRGWGTVCSNYPFDDKEADTVCRQLGYTGANEHTSLYSYSSYPILLNDVQCPTSNEECLGACRLCSQGVNNNNCYSRLSIECMFDTLHYSFGSNVSSCEYEEGGFLLKRPGIGEVRLNPSNNMIAELNYNTSANNITWSQICSGSSNDQNIADTFCTQLGYTGNARYSSLSSTNGPFLSISCPQNYTHLLRCTVTIPETCSSVLTVTCDDSGPYYTGQIRLRGGDYPSEGRVEIYVYGVWSSIYASSSNYNDESNTICRQLGYTGAVYYDQGLIPGNGTIHVVYPYCSWEMACFSQCLYSSDFREGSSGYSHYYDLSVNCTFNQSLAQSLSYGSESSCVITVPTRPDRLSGGYIALIVLLTIGFLACVIVIGIVSISVICTKKAKRRARQRQAAVGPVTYNPHVPIGATTGPIGFNSSQVPMSGPVYMVPVNQIPSTGMLLMPQGANQMQSPPQYTAENEEKTMPSNTEEVTAN